MDAQGSICKYPTHTTAPNPPYCAAHPSIPITPSLPFHPPQTPSTSLTHETHQYAQELLSTFSTSLGEVALQPATGGVFVVEITTESTESTAAAAPSTTQIQRAVLWDRKVDGGFPETKELKRRVRDVIQPGRDLGHVDRDYYSGRGKKEGDGEGGVKKEEEEEGAVKGMEGQKKAVDTTATGSGSSTSAEGKACEMGEACSVEEEGGRKCEDCE